MKYLIIALVVFILLFATMSCTSKAPENLGLNNGQLAPVPSSPNGVSSFAPTNDPEHYIAPSEMKSPLNEELSKVKKALKTWPRTKLVTEEQNYLHYECTSLVFRFVDDLEVYFDVENQKIHFRSASRVGHSDFGVNRKRVEKLKSSL